MSWIHTFPTSMGEAMQVSQDILCLILTHSADADSEKLKSDVCQIDRLVLNEILKKINYGEMCWYSLDGKWRNYKDSLKPPHGHAMLMFEDGNRKVMKARRGAMGRCGTRLQCCRAYREDLNVWSCLFSPQHLPSALRPAITHSR